MKAMKILQFLNPPPPIGGVTLSVQNLVRSIRAYEKCVKCSFRKEDGLFDLYDLGHVHASNRYKRLFQIIYLKLKCKRVLFTVHGLWLNDSFINRLCIKYADGVVFLNDKLLEFWSVRTDKPIVKLPSLFKEGFELVLESGRRKDQKLTLLLYAHNSSSMNGCEIYGVEFAFRSLLRSGNKFRLIFVDLSGDYKNLVREHQSDLDIDYYSGPVDFNKMLNLCDIYLRPTCMDGSSLAVQEALLLGKTVVASDVVDREPGVLLFEYQDEDDFLNQIFSGERSNGHFELQSVEKYFSYISQL